MARAQGARAQMALGFETVYGTPPVSGFRLMPFARTTLGSEQPLLESELLGYGRDPLAPMKDAVTADELAVTEAEALERAIGRTFRWHYLLRGGKQEVLSEEAQKGLIGEIEALKLLMTNFGPKPALTAWTGPSGAPKDFELKADCIEVKARRGASQPFVKITNEHQLADVPDRRLWLAVLAVDKVQQPHGKTLTEYVADVTDRLERSEPSAIMDWDLHLADVGYDVLHDYSAWRWIVSAPDFHVVSEGFPRISAPVPLGVSAVSYALALSACIPFRTDWRNVQTKLIEEVQP